MMTRRHVLEMTGLGVAGLLGLRVVPIAAQAPKTAVVTLIIDGMT